MIFGSLPDSTMSALTDPHLIPSDFEAFSIRFEIFSKICIGCFVGIIPPSSIIYGFVLFI